MHGDLTPVLGRYSHICCRDAWKAQHAWAGCWSWSLPGETGCVQAALTIVTIASFAGEYYASIQWDRGNTGSRVRKTPDPCWFNE
jgi:hypothetical protein